MEAFITYLIAMPLFSLLNMRFFVKKRFGFDDGDDTAACRRDPKAILHFWQKKPNIWTLRWVGPLPVGAGRIRIRIDPERSRLYYCANW
jgi:hypothetical protein